MVTLCKCRVNTCDTHILSTEKSYPYCEVCMRMRDALMQEHVSAIHKVAIDEMRFGSGAKLGDVEDCFQVASIAFLRAVDLFDPNRKYIDKKGKEQNVKFISYAVSSMKRCLHMACLDSGVMHVPHQEVAKAAADCNRVKDNTKKVYQALNMSSLNVLEDEELIGYHWDGNEIDEINERTELINQAMSRIKNPRDRQIVQSRIYDGHTLEQIGDAHNIGKERARQLYVRSVAKMQEHFQVPVKLYRTPNKLGLKTNKRPEPEKLGVMIAPKSD